MSKSPIFFRRNSDSSRSIELTREECSHLKSLRLFSVQKEVEIRDGRGNSSFYDIPGNRETGQLQRTEKNICVPGFSAASALPKSQKLDLILQKLTELGADHIHLIVFAQSDRKEFNEKRAEKIILSAAEQSERHSLPEIHFHKSLEEFIRLCPGSFYLHPYADRNISDGLPGSVPVIGPEGGFRDSEIELMRKNGMEGCRFGSSILRIETAVIAASVIIKYLNLRDGNESTREKTYNIQPK